MTLCRQYRLRSVPSCSWRHILLLLCLVCVGSPHAKAQDFLIESADTRIVEGVYRLNTRIDYSLNEEVLQALDSGVPITFVLEIEVLRPREWMWDETVYSQQQRYRLEYHALTKQYLVTNLDSNIQYSYPTKQTALYATGIINDLPMVELSHLEPGESYTARLRARLALDTLPSPLRFWAYLSSEWRQTSRWHTWLLQ